MSIGNKFTSPDDELCYYSKKDRTVKPEDNAILLESNNSEMYKLCTLFINASKMENLELGKLKCEEIKVNIINLLTGDKK